MFSWYILKPLYVIPGFRKHRSKKNKVPDTREKLSDPESRAFYRTEQASSTGQWVGKTNG